jgi:toxin ParE1/3/4
VRRRLVISRNAETDLILIWVYYAEKSERAAQRIRQEIVSKYNLLLQFPLAGRNRDELQAGLRSLPVGNHIIFYREIEDGIEIVRVLHGAQDVLGIFSPEDEGAEEPPTE